MRCSAKGADRRPCFQVRDSKTLCANLQLLLLSAANPNVVCPIWAAWYMLGLSLIDTERCDRVFFFLFFFLDSSDTTSPHLHERLGLPRWQIIAKPLVCGQADTTIMNKCTLEQLTQQLPVTHAVSAPQALSSAAQLDQQLFLLLEVRSSTVATRSQSLKCAHFGQDLCKASSREPHCFD